MKAWHRLKVMVTMWGGALVHDSVGAGVSAHAAAHDDGSLLYAVCCVQDACAKLKSLTACEEPKVRVKQVGKFRRARRPNDAAVVEEAGAGKCVV